MATERAGAATFQGNGLTLVGDAVKVGDAAPDFSVLADDLSAVTLANYAGKVKVICLVPSLDTPVCDTEIRRFNQEAAGLGDNVAVLAVSADLPFAQKRWCGDAGADNVTALSDHRDTSLGVAYGAVIKELRLLSPAERETGYVLGVWYLNLEEDNDRVDTGLYAEPGYAPGPSEDRFDSGYGADSLALFGELSRAFAGQWRVSVGLRWEQRDSDYADSNGEQFSPADDMLGGHVSVYREYLCADCARLQGRRVQPGPGRPGADQR